jgi:hypothetical protein
MKRIQLFEFEDLSWFPNWLRTCLMRMMVVMHNLLNTSEEMAELVNRVMKQSDTDTIIDLGSGGGGPMLRVCEILKSKYDVESPRLIMTDFFPNLAYAEEINSQNNPSMSYITEPVDATNVGSDLEGLRTMVGSFHHMNPNAARQILQNAVDSKQPICIFEISDNSFPKMLWWIAIPVNIVTSLVVSLLARPMTWQQLFFTYVVPVIPITFAWDGAVSNARTYTLKDLDILLNDLVDDDYNWEKGVINGKSKKIYLLGWPRK